MATCDINTLLANNPCFLELSQKAQLALIADLLCQISASGGTGGATAFTQLTDVPASYSGAANEFVTVNSGATGLQFITNATAGKQAGIFPLTNNHPTTDVPSYNGQWGVSPSGFLWQSTGTSAGNWAYNGLGIGSLAVGDPGGLLGVAGHTISSTFNFCCNTTDAAAFGDCGLQLFNFNISPANSGNAMFLAVMAGTNNGSGISNTVDPVGCSFAHVPKNRSAGIIPANAMLVFNRDNTNNKGLAVAVPGIGGLDFGNYSLLYADFKNSLFRIPKWTAGVYQPSDTLYTFTVTAPTNAPIVNDIYSNNGVNFTVYSLSGTTLTATGQGAPTASGTLTLVFSAQVVQPDGTVAFSAESATNTWVDVVNVNPSTGAVSMGISTSTVVVGGTFTTAAGIASALAPVAGGGIFIDTSGNVNVCPNEVNTGMAAFKNFVCLGRNNPTVGPISLDLQGGTRGFNFQGSGVTDIQIVGNGGGVLIGQWNDSDGSYNQLVGNILVSSAGKGFRVKEGSNAKMGTLTLNGATPVVVSNTSVTATSRIFLTVQATGGTPSGIAYVSARSAGTSFSVTSMALDTSTVAYLILEPA